MDKPTFVIDDQPAVHDLDFVETHINQHNVAMTGAVDYRPLAIFVRNEQQDIIPGLAAYTWAGMCEVQLCGCIPISGRAMVDGSSQPPSTRRRTAGAPS